MEKELKKYGLSVCWRNQDGRNSSDPDDYEPIDFSIDDGVDNVAWVWGSNPSSDVQIECNHPDELIEFGDDDERGVCPICGATCDWGWVNDVVDEGHEDGMYYAYTGNTRVISQWHTPEKIGGIVGRYLKHLQEEW